MIGGGWQAGQRYRVMGGGGGRQDSGIVWVCEGLPEDNSHHTKHTPHATKCQTHHTPYEAVEQAVRRKSIISTPTLTFTFNIANH